MAFHGSVSLFLVLCVICVGVNAQNPDIGKILIGTQGNYTADYQFSTNANSNRPVAGIPFSAFVYRSVDGSIVNKRDIITVRCENQFAGQVGYTKLTFFDTILPAVDPNGVVAFELDLSSPGRTAEVRCYGVSDGVTTGTLQCPATSDTSITQPQFCRETSISDVINIAFTPAPVLSICQNVIVIPVDAVGTTFIEVVQVTLSEPVRGANVTVTCQPNNNAISGCTQSNSADFISTPQINIGQTTASVEYRITRGNEQTCLGIMCWAESQQNLPIGNYKQYQRSTSTDTAMIRSFPPEVKMEPQFMSVYNTSFQSVIYMDVNTEVEVPFQCQATVVNTLEEALAKVNSPNCNFNVGTTTTMATTSFDPNATSAIPTLPPDPSSPWIAMDSSFIVDISTKYHVVRTERLLSVIAPVQEIVVTACCSTYSSLSSYMPLKATTVSVAMLEPLRNKTGGVTSGTSGTERVIIKPAYQEVAPCPCDLTYQACDINCCCDGGCSSTELETFSSCIPGRLGGLDPGPDLRNCKSGHFPKDDWFPLMCVQFESNALLGMFYSNTGKLGSTVAIDATLAETQDTEVYTYQETDARDSDIALVPSYKTGFSLLSISSQNVYGILPLPQRLSSGQCLDLAPVQFLNDTASTCPRTLTPATCEGSPLFNLESFVQPTSLYKPACPKAFSISSDGSGADQTVEVKVNYYCANDVTAYIKSTQVFSDLVQPEQVYTFPPGLETVNCSIPCNESTVCLNFNTGQDEPSVTPLPPRCSSDDGFSLPPAVSYTGGQCQNMVLEVRYRLMWAGQKVTGLTADVVLGNVPVAQGQSVMVNQKFSTTFSHDYTGPANQTDNYSQLGSGAFQRSGRPGYELGKPIATGCSSTNETTGEALPVDQDPTKQMAIWSPGADGLCENAKRRFLTFGDDMQSSCALRLAFDDIANCDSLKSLIFNHLNVLMPSSVIGRYGYNNPNFADMWVDILREDPYAPEEETTTVAPIITTTTTPNTPGNTTANETELFDPLTWRRGVCQDVLNGVHLEVMYAETGQSYAYPILEIIGASVRFSKGNWSMPCTGPGSPARCRNGTSETQPFLLTSSVQYTKVSAKAPEKQILFYEVHKKDRCDTDTCYRFYTDFDTSVCHYDTCWQELVYPLTAGYVGYESVHYTRSFTLLFIVFALGYIAVTKPWK